MSPFRPQVLTHLDERLLPLLMLSPCDRRSWRHLVVTILDEVKELLGCFPETWYTAIASCHTLAHFLYGSRWGSSTLWEWSRYW